MNLKLSYLLTVTSGFGCFSAQAMQQYRTNVQAEQKYAADARIDIQATEPKLDKQYKVQIATITEEFINNMNRAMRMAALCDGKVTQESLKLAQEAFRELMAWLPEKSGAYDVQLLEMMAKVHAGFRHIDTELTRCQAQAQEARTAQQAEQETHFRALQEHLGRLNLFRATMFSLMEQWNKPMAEVYVLSHALLTYLHDVEFARIQEAKGLKKAARWLKFKARMVIPFNRVTGTRIPVEILGRLGKREDWDLTTEQINVARTHIQHIEKNICALFEQSGLNATDVVSMEPDEMRARDEQRYQENLQRYAQTWPLTKGYAEGLFPFILSPDRKSEFAAARNILIECKRALEAPIQAAKLRDCLANIDKSVNVLNRSLMRLKALRIVGHTVCELEGSSVRLTAEERTLIAGIAEYRRLRADYPIIDDNAWKAVVGAVAQGSSAASGLMDRTATQIERWNAGIAGAILQAPRYTKLLEKLLENYRLGVQAVEFVQILHNNLNSWGYQTADIIGFARGLVSENNQVGKLIVYNLRNNTAFEAAWRKLQRPEAALNDAAEVLYHVLGFFNERGIHILEIALRWAGPIENILMGAKAIADYAEGQQFAEYLTGKLQAVSGGAGNSLRRVGTALNRTALLTHSRWGLTPRNYAEGLQVVAEMSTALMPALPEAVTKVTVRPDRTIRIHAETPLAAIDSMQDNPQLKVATFAEIKSQHADSVAFDEDDAAEAARIAAAHSEVKQNAAEIKAVAEEKVSAAQAAEIKVNAGRIEEGLSLGGLASDVQPSRQATHEAEVHEPAAAPEIKVKAEAAEQRATEPAAPAMPAPAQISIAELQRQRIALHQESIGLMGRYRSKAEEKERIAFELQYALSKNADREVKAAAWGRWHYLYRMTHWPYRQAYITKLQNDQQRVTAEFDALHAQIEAGKQTRTNNIMALNAALKLRTGLGLMQVQGMSLSDDQLESHIGRAYAAHDNKQMEDDLVFLNSEEVRLNRDISNAQKLQSIKWKTWRPNGWFSWAWGKLRGKVSGHETRELANLRLLLARVQYRKQLLNAKIKEFRDELAQIGLNLSTPVILTLAQKQELKDLHPELFSDLR